MNTMILILMMTGMAANAGEVAMADLPAEQIPEGSAFVAKKETYQQSTEMVDSRTGKKTHLVRWDMQSFVDGLVDLNSSCLLTMRSEHAFELVGRESKMRSVGFYNSSLYHETSKGVVHLFNKTENKFYFGKPRVKYDRHGDIETILFPLKTTIVRHYSSGSPVEHETGIQSTLLCKRGYWSRTITVGEVLDQIGRDFNFVQKQ